MANESRRRRATDSGHGPLPGIDIKDTHIIECFLMRRPTKQHELVAHVRESAADAGRRTATLRANRAPIHRHEDVDIVEACLAVMASNCARQIRPRCHHEARYA